MWDGWIALEEVHKRLGIPKLDIYLDSINKITGLKISTGLKGGFVVEIKNSRQFQEYVEHEWAAQTKKILIDPVKTSPPPVVQVSVGESLTQTNGSFRSVYRRLRNGK